jgi:RNA polymerase sigma-70 factor (ECF subfamily)
VLAAQDASTTRARDALASLCETYWYPLYAYLRRRGSTADEAQDLTQGFFTRLLDKGWVSAADPARGRFRAFLLTALKHYAANERDRARTAKRGGKVRQLSLDADAAEARYRLEPTDLETPERLYERGWAITLLNRTLARLRAEYERAGKAELFDRLKGCLTGEEPGPTYAEIGQALRMSEGAVKVAAHRMRKRFGRLIRDEIAQTVADDRDIEEEIQHLFEAVQ